MQHQGLKALVFGATGSIGTDLVRILLSSNKWQKVHCVVRKQIQEWKTLPGKEKLIVEIHQNLDDYFKLQNNQYSSYSSLFCCFGSQTKYGQETFIKVDKTYPLLAADIAIQNKIPHYLLVSSMGSDPNSWFLYPKTKGQVQSELKEKKLNFLSIFKPGVLRNRKEARTVEKIFGFFPFVPGIQSKDVAKVLKIIAEQRYAEQATQTNKVYVYQNKDMINIAQGQIK